MVRTETGKISSYKKKSETAFVNQQLLYRSVSITRQGAGYAGFESRQKQ